MWGPLPRRRTLQRLAAGGEDGGGERGDWDTEWCDLELGVKAVSGLDEAIEHINAHGSQHTDVILSEDKASVEQFMQRVDSAGVYHNCSSRFADGFRYGFGAEVGISTGRLHARGPVGLEGLVTYKYRMYGGGHIAKDYDPGADRTFTHRPVEPLPATTAAVRDRHA